MELPTLDDLLDAIRSFCARHNMKPSRFGREATRDANLITALERGVWPSLERAHRIRDYMANKDEEAGFTADHISATSDAASKEAA